MINLLENVASAIILKVLHNPWKLIQFHQIAQILLVLLAWHWTVEDRTYHLFLWQQFYYVLEQEHEAVWIVTVHLRMQYLLLQAEPLSMKQEGE